MKPIYSLLFLITIALFCSIILLIFPKDGIKINEHLTLHFSWNFYQKNDSTKKKMDISLLVKEYETEINTEKKEPISLSNKQLEDTIKKTITTKKQNIRKKIKQKIEYPSGDSLLLYPFFEKLSQASKKRVRIFHYGDSQIEGDRISGYLRNKFQKQFGGSGAGLIPILPRHAPSSSFIHQASNNWIKHAVYYKRDSILHHKEFGLLGSFARFARYNDTTNQTKKAWILFKHSGMAYKSAQKFTECKVFFAHADTSFFVKGFVDDTLKWFKEVKKSTKMNHFHWKFDKAPKRLKIEYEATQSPDLYAIALDDKIGVAVDNLPFRGSAGTEFSKLDYLQSKQMAEQLNVGLIILQFGVNVVPYMNKNYSFYEKTLTRQLNYLKKIFQNAPLIIVSVSDMSMKKGDGYISYPNIGKIKQAQKNAAKKTNCAFWDLHNAMGGENSMPQWVNAKPSLATKDFIHFNRRGGNLIANMIYKAIDQEYEKFKRKSKTNLSKKNEIIPK